MTRYDVLADAALTPGLTLLLGRRAWWLAVLGADSGAAREKQTAGAVPVSTLH